jgi:hypothetical protein
MLQAHAGAAAVSNQQPPKQSSSKQTSSPGGSSRGKFLSTVRFYCDLYCAQTKEGGFCLHPSSKVAADRQGLKKGFWQLGFEAAARAIQYETGEDPKTIRKQMQE